MYVSSVYEMLVAVHLIHERRQDESLPKDDSEKIRGNKTLKTPHPHNISKLQQMCECVFVLPL